MNIYEKPMMFVESLEAKNVIAADEGYLGEIDTINGDEVSIVAPDTWLGY